MDEWWVNRKLMLKVVAVLFIVVVFASGVVAIISGDTVFQKGIKNDGINCTEFINVNGKKYNDGSSSIMLDKSTDTVAPTNDSTPPIVLSPSANPPIITNDGTNFTHLTVNVTDDSIIDAVTIDMSPMGDSSVYYLYYLGQNLLGCDVNTTSSPGMFNLTVNATDICRNFNNSVNITLEVIVRSEVKGIILSLSKTTALSGVSLPASLSIQNTGGDDTVASLTGHLNETTFTITPSETSHIPVGNTIDHAFNFTVPADMPSKTYTLLIEIAPINKSVTDAISTLFNVLNETTGTLTVITTPRDANVTVEGGLSGISPYGQILDPGTYTLHIQKSGYGDIDDNAVVVEVGNRTVEYYTLEEI